MTSRARRCGNVCPSPPGARLTVKPQRFCSRRARHRWRLPHRSRPAPSRATRVRSRSCYGRARRALELAPRDHDLRGPLLAQTAVLLHASGRVAEARAFAETQLRDALPAEQVAEVLISIGGMFSIPPDTRAAACRQALALPELPQHLRAHNLAALFHNLLVAGRPEQARAIHAETAAAVEASGDPNSAFTLA